MQIIKRYYGGRDISDEDLERALQVGMTPHERRRFEKKRGFSFKHSTGSTATVPEQNNHIGCSPRMSNVDDLKTDVHDGSYENEVDTELFMRKDDFRNSTSASDLTVNGPDSAALNEDEITVATADCNEGGDSATVNVDNSCRNRTQTNGLGDLSCSPNDEKSIHTEHNSKLSLLGHGPHGKQVVEHLLREYGEDGIREFCQRWRQVFVDAVKPRFLPGGWDVKHRYAMIIRSSIFLTTSCHPYAGHSCSMNIYLIYSIYLLRHIDIEFVLQEHKLYSSLKKLKEYKQVIF